MSSGTRELATPTLMFGIPIDDVTLAETVEHVVAMAERGRATGRSYQVATVNVDFLVNSLADPELLSLLQHADLAVPDGMPVVWGSKLLGSPVRERVAGADLVPALAQRCADTGQSMYLFGAAPGIAERAAAMLRERHPGLRVVGDGGPFFDRPGDMDPEALHRIRDARPDILCVALGHPKQEKWIQMYRRSADVPVMIGVGGSLDFLVGHKRRAPEWMQRTGTEWVYRTLQEPRRLIKRYTRDLTGFGPRLLWEFLLQPLYGPAEGSPPLVARDGDTTVIRSRGRLRIDAATFGWTEDRWRQTARGHRVVIDLDQQKSLTHRECCAIVGLAKRLAAGDGQLVLTSVPPAIDRTLRRLRLDAFLAVAPSDATSSIALATAHSGIEPLPVQARSLPLDVGKQITHA